MKGNFINNCRSSYTIAVCVLAISARVACGKVIYVDINSPQDGPGTSYSNAFHTIQQGIDAAVNGDTVLVSDGTYASGGSTAPVSVNKPITLASARGPQVTEIRVPDAANNRCVFLGTNAVLTGFTVSNGRTSERGAGIYCEQGAVVYDCIIRENQSYSDAPGVYGGTLYNCSIISNSMFYSVQTHAPAGGGACNSVLLQLPG